MRVCQAFGIWRLANVGDVVAGLGQRGGDVSWGSRGPAGEGDGIQIDPVELLGEFAQRGVPFGADAEDDLGDRFRDGRSGVARRLMALRHSR